MNNGQGPQGDDGTIPNGWFTVTAADAIDISDVATKGLYVAVAGNLVMRTFGNPTNTLTIVVVAGQYIYGRISRVMTATTATVFAMGG